MPADRKTRVRGADNAPKTRYFKLADGRGQVAGGSSPSPLRTVRAPMPVGTDKHGRPIIKTADVGKAIDGTRVVEVSSAVEAAAIQRTGQFSECDKPTTSNKD